MKPDEALSSSSKALRSEQNIFSKSVGAAKGDERTALLEKGKTLSAAVKEADQRRTEAETNFFGSCFTSF